MDELARKATVFNQIGLGGLINRRITGIKSEEHSDGSSISVLSIAFEDGRTLTIEGDNGWDNCSSLDISLE